MDPGVAERLGRLGKARVVRVEYQCATCGYLLYRRLERDEAGRLWRPEEAGRRLVCPGCGEEALALVDVRSERDWTRAHPDHAHGG